MRAGLTNRSTSTVAMFAPTPAGGHALYTEEVMVALNGVARPDRNYELLTSRDLDAARRNAAYAINDILPALKLRENFRFKIQWVISRLTHYFRRDFLTFTWLLKRPDVRVIHMQEFATWTAWALVPMVRMALQRRVGITVHNIYPHLYPRYIPRFFVDKINKFIFLNCEFLIVHSEKLRHDLIQFVGESRRDKIYVAPHGVWTPKAGQVSAVASEQLATALFFGTIRKNKGLDVLLDAMTFLSKKVRLLIAGFPDDMAYFNQIIRPKIDALRVDGCQIELIASYIDEKNLPDLFASARLLVLPYREFSAQSGVLFNAIAFGLPVVATSEGALGETVDRFRIGVTIKENSPEEIAAAIEAVLLSDFKKTFQSGFEAARADLSWDRHAEILSYIYE
ncbi:glycosyltransferase [Paraburkholderia aspalathi]|uniref:Glycosyltransferase involved in cell wall bisynthesis n=1 Tax=Paraburkholderia aspalathi TaxID=1324617 RepID=A0A1I7E7V8_9BURK|nr:glycosyltransferase [Paraburkholderia aspalathi]SFU20011.1 Glycosyltransferase involved in cell wall bisynthesis [Paraburkholderia aspalathi]